MLLQDWLADLRFALRLHWRRRWFALAAILTLALAMGMSNTVYTVVNAMILRGLPVVHPDRIVMFNDRSPNSFTLNVSYRDVADWRERTSAFAEIAFWSSTLATIADADRSPDVVGGSYVSANIFRVVEQQPIVGRDFLDADEQPGAAPVVILGYSVWASRYGNDPSIVGRKIRLNGTPATVVGVMPAGFRFPLVDDIWLPLPAMPALDRENREVRPFRACGRLHAGVSLSRANAEIASVADRIAREHTTANRTVRVGVLPYTGTVSFSMFQALFGAVACLLLIACANVSNLLLAQSEARGYEIAVRIAHGASRWRIVRLLLIESAVLATVAAFVGFLLSIAGVKAFAYAVEGINFAYWYRDRWTMDHRVFVFMAMVCSASAFAFGLVPAIQLTRADVHERLKRNERRTAGGSHRWPNALVGAQLTVALMLLVAAGLMVRSFLAEYFSDLTADAAHVLTASLRPPPSRAGVPPDRLALYRRIEDRLRSHPSVIAAVFASTPPYIGGPMYEIARDEQRPVDGPVRRASFVAVDPGYFETLNVRLLRGRAFEEADGLPGHEAAIVNQQFVDAIFGNQDPLSQRICAFAPDNRTPPFCAPVVGVSPTVRQQFMADLDPVVYFPLRVNPSTAMLLVRSADMTAAANAVRAGVGEVDPDVIVWRMVALETWMQQSRWGYRVFGTMFGVFAAIALALCAVGIYAVTAYSVVERTREIGIRMALGAHAGSVVLMFVRRKLLPLTLGLALGLAGAFATGRLIENMLVRTSPADPLTLVSVGGLLALVAVAAVLIPAFRASRIPPSVALRRE